MIHKPEANCCQQIDKIEWHIVPLLKTLEFLNEKKAIIILTCIPHAWRISSLHIGQLRRSINHGSIQVL